MGRTIAYLPAKLPAVVPRTDVAVKERTRIWPGASSSDGYNAMLHELSDAP